MEGKQENNTIEIFSSKAAVNQNVLPSNDSLSANQTQQKCYQFCCALGVLAHGLTCELLESLWGELVMNVDQKRKSCRMVSNLRHILPICKEEGVGGNSHNVPSILLFLFHLAILPGLIWDIYLKPCTRLGSETTVSFFSVFGCSMSARA